MNATEEYLTGLTEAEQDEAEKIEDELNAVAREGFTERAALAFVKAVPAIRKAVPEATIGGILDMALIQGLGSVLRAINAPDTSARPAAPKRKGTSRSTLK